MVGGVQRFPGNRIISHLYEQAAARGYALNDLWRDFPKGKDARTREGRDMRELYRLFGYSVCGYTEIFSNDRIENPLWDSEDEGDRK